MKDPVYIFVDIDGVLNTRDHLARQLKQSKSCSKLNWCPIACNNLVRLCRRYGGQIVVSSSWRHDFNLEELRDHFIRNGIPGEFVADTTPAYAEQTEGGNYCRGDEIRQWLSEHSALDSLYLILDDHEVMLKSQQQQYVKVNPADGFANRESLTMAVYILSAGG